MTTVGPEWRDAGESTSRWKELRVVEHTDGSGAEAAAGSLAWPAACCVALGKFLNLSLSLVICKMDLIIISTYRWYTVHIHEALRTVPGPTHVCEMRL